MNQDRINRNMRMKLAGIISFLEDQFNFDNHYWCCTEKICAFETPDSCPKVIKNPRPVKATGPGVLKCDSCGYCTVCRECPGM